MNNRPLAFRVPTMATGWFQGQLTAGLPLAATMGRLANKSLCPVGARQRLDATKPMAISKPDGGPRFPLDLMHPHRKTVAKGAKAGRLSAP